MTSDPRDNERTDYDARFAAIIAQFDDDPLDSSALDERPSGADDDAGAGATPAPLQPEDPQPAPPVDPIAELPAQWRMPSREESAALLEDDGTYEPPPPQPLPAGDLHFWAILAGLVGGPLWLLYLFLLDRMAKPMWWVLACATTAAGVVLLILRQPHSREDQDDHDDGAVL
ncbi:hypothetical protein [Luteipulveratus halotolerans]|uniref:hypothetical protein n=1 Tax=Luteipulveratus halotolerans TaxID=1631356 RepID=UPI0006814F13|nr:hypothetical protein [Luteipulveratus halotolerans]